MSVYFTSFVCLVFTALLSPEKMFNKIKYLISMQFYRNFSKKLEKAVPLYTILVSSLVVSFMTENKNTRTQNSSDFSDLLKSKT